MDDIRTEDSDAGMTASEAARAMSRKRWDSEHARRARDEARRRRIAAELAARPISDEDCAAIMRLLPPLSPERYAELARARRAGDVDTTTMPGAA